MSNDEIARLIGRVALRDRAAFDCLYGRTSAKLFGIILRMLKDRPEAEDVLQEVYVKIWHNAAKFQDVGLNPVSWLIAIARNHAIDRIRARQPNAMPLDAAHEIADDAPDPEQEALASAQRHRIEECLGRLKPMRAAAIRGAYVEGYSYQELAARHRLPLNTLRTWLRRGLLSLKECLER